MWGVNESDVIFYKHNSTSDWKIIPGKLTQIEVGIFGVFGLDSHGRIYYRVGTHENPTSSGKDWQLINGDLKLSRISVGTDNIWGVNDDDQIYIIDSWTLENGEMELKWKRIGGLLKQVAINGSYTVAIKPLGNWLRYIFGK